MGAGLNLELFTEWRPMRFAHTHIAARDWRRLTDFYVKVFQCRVKPPERNLMGPWLDRATGLINGRLEGVHLLLPGHGEEGPTLEIFSYRDMPEGAPPAAHHPGITHIAFEVDDVQRTLTAALKQGGHALGRVTKVTVDGVCELKFVYFRDPEGNIVEIQSRKQWEHVASIWSRPARGKTPPSGSKPE
jgi:catechol 2,3-dioxygenase-like lactoylglutathione lyase family enzyme